MWKDSSTEGPRQVAPAPGASARNTSRRKRTSFSKEHVELLLSTFETDPYPGISLRESLSQTTGLPESRIQVWFQNRRARTMKCKGAKKPLWQSDSPTQEGSPPSPGTDSAPQPGAAPRLSARRPPPPPYPAQVKEEPEDDCFYGGRPPAYGALGEPGPAPSPPGGRSQSLWSPAPLEVRNYSSGSGLPYPEYQQPYFLSQQAAPPHTPDSGYWESGQENTPPADAPYCQLEGQWGGAYPGSYWPPQQQHAPLPELPALSLQDILQELEGGWGWGDGLDSHVSHDNSLVY